MLDFLKQIVDFFAALGSFVMNIVSGLVYLLTMIPKAMVVITNVLAYVPTQVMAFAMVAITISVVFLIIDR